GLLTMLLGFGTPLALVAAMFHVLNHATFKAALFMSAGIIDHAAHTRDIRQLGGLRHLMPVTATLAIIAAASMAGVPLLNGFVSKEMMLEQAVHTSYAGQSWLLPVLATAGALLSAAYSLRLIVHVFFGPQRAPVARAAHDPPAGMWLPVAVLVLPVVLLGVLPALATSVVRATALAAAGGELPAFQL